MTTKKPLAVVAMAVLGLALSSGNASAQFVQSTQNFNGFTGQTYLSNNVYSPLSGGYYNNNTGYNAFTGSGFNYYNNVNPFIGSYNRGNSVYNPYTNTTTSFRQAFNPFLGFRTGVYQRFGR